MAIYFFACFDEPHFSQSNEGAEKDDDDDEYDGSGNGLLLKIKKSKRIFLPKQISFLWDEKIQHWFTCKLICSCK